MAKIAILGFGTVGSGVYEVLCRNAAGVSRRAGEPVEVKYILDPKDFSDHPAAKLFIKNFDAILEDPEVKVVVETIGGTRFAYPYVKACLESGRSVCTSNKEMVATYGAELLALAKAHKAEARRASVARHAHHHPDAPAASRPTCITEVEGIVNGTTNFMLTKMVRENLGFDEALKIAQELGYAETKDPRRRCGRPRRLPQDRHPVLRWSAATRSTPRTSPPAASATSRWMMWLRQRSWAASSSSSPG